MRYDHQPQKTAGTNRTTNERRRRKRTPNRCSIFRGRSRFGPHTLLHTLVLLVIVGASAQLAVMHASAEHATTRAPTSAPQILALEIDATIENSYARTTVTQQLANPTNASCETQIAFSIPPDAFISNLTLQRDETLYYGSVVERETAAERYDAAKAEGQSAALVAASDTASEAFTLALNLAPYETIRAKLQYEEYLVRTVDGYRYTTGLEIQTSAPIGTVAFDATVRYDRAIDELQPLPQHMPFQLSHADNGSYTVAYRAENVTAVPAFTLAYEVAPTNTAGQLLASANDEGEGYFMHIYAPGADALGGYMPKDIAFVLDVSGSMSGTKIAQMKEAFTCIVDQLHPEDDFNLIFFSNGANCWKKEFVPATESNRDAAAEFVASQYAGGSTNAHDALVVALEMLQTPDAELPVIVFLTDGHPNTNGGPDEVRNAVRRKNHVEAAIFTLGFGDGANMDFLDALAEENRGSALKIDAGTASAAQLVEFYATISTPLLRNIWFFYPSWASDIYPERRDYLFDGSEIVVTGRFDANDTDAFTFITNAMSGAGERAFSDTVHITTMRDDAFVERFWAYQRIRAIASGDLASAESAQAVLDGEATALAIAYGFVCDYTSMIVELPVQEPEEPAVAPDENMDGGAAEKPSAGPATDPSTSVPLASPSRTSGEGDANDLEYEECDEAMGSPGFSLGILLIALGAIVAVVIAGAHGRRRS